MYIKTSHICMYNHTYMYIKTSCLFCISTYSNVPYYSFFNLVIPKCTCTCTFSLANNYVTQNSM